jgi:orotidine-5'-phosphate decarboxylase
MNRAQLIRQISQKQSYLCIGLDSDIRKIPSHLLKEKDPVFTFNKAIIDATHPYAVAYKPNLAFYESNGLEGWESLQKTLEYIPRDCFTIADAKRGDIGNTSSLYAKAFFEKMNFDSVTVAPYMGEDSVKPFLEFKDKWVILLALTSNPGAHDFQINTLNDGKEMLFERVLTVSKSWGNTENLMFVVGATQAGLIKKVRAIVPEHFLLVPGVGAQGGSLKDISMAGMNQDCGLLVNSSRQIIFASDKTDFPIKAAAEAKKMQEEMADLLKEMDFSSAGSV